MPPRHRDTKRVNDTQTQFTLHISALEALLKCPDIEGAPTEMAASMADKAQILMLACNAQAHLTIRVCSFLHSSHHESRLRRSKHGHFAREIRAIDEPQVLFLSDALLACHVALAAAIIPQEEGFLARASLHPLYHPEVAWQQVV